MNRELKRVSVVVLLMFVALFVSLSILQVFQADSLNADARNSRTLYDSYSAQRGAILVAGQPIAESVPVDDNYKYQRVYSNGPLYSAVTGFFPINGAPTGLEGALGEELSGTSNSQFFSRVNSILTGKNPQGDSVETTIDPVAQQAAYDALGDQQGAVVLIEPKTGRILALVSKPDFDPNTLAGHDSDEVETTYQSLLADPNEPLINRAITALNPPGSSFKPVVMAAALGTGQFTPDSQFPNPAGFELPGSSTTVTNTGGGRCGGGATVSIGTAQILSCNIPFAELGIQLGNRAMRDQAKAFGFDKELTIPMTVTPSQFPIETDPAAIAMSAFGQKDDRVTALQMAMVSAGISNGGKVMRPNLVDAIRSSDLKEVQGFSPELFSQATSPEIAATISQLMVQGVNAGAADNARIDGVSVGGKTGTAQNDVGEPYTLWFTGFAPADDPRFAVAVVLENGGGRGQDDSGNELAAPIAKKVLEAVLNK